MRAGSAGSGGMSGSSLAPGQAPTHHMTVMLPQCPLQQGQGTGERGTQSVNVPFLDNRALDVEHPRVNPRVSNAFPLTKQKTSAGTY